MSKPHHPPDGFAQLGIETPLLRALEKLGWTTPSDIQNQLIPHVLGGRDVLGQARTGTGKTGAFGLPFLQMIQPNAGLQLLVLVPTRELAVQVAAELLRMAQLTNLRIVPVYGGQRIATQEHALGKKPCVVVGTPGRVMDFMQRGKLAFDHLRFVVLDEVDRMLDIGFRDDIRYILGKIEQPHQTVFVSATLSDEIKRLATRYMKDPLEINVSRDEITVEQVTQTYVSVDPWDKFRALRHVLAQEKPKLAIIFCNTKRGVSKLAKRLHGEGIDAREIHGDLVQRKREKVMDHFRKHNLHVLVATDLAARGIDVQGITHIINYDVPDDPEVYVHRIGRTARMGSFGMAIMLVTREQGKQLTEIEKLINRQVTALALPDFTPSPQPSDWLPERKPGQRLTTLSSGPYAATTQTDTAATPAAASPPKRLGARFVRKRRL